jgi:hypothetical protein
VELDALRWLRNWSVDPGAFRTKVGMAVARDAWIIDGNYLRVISSGL